jgi:hypothetical protein
MDEREVISYNIELQQQETYVLWLPRGEGGKREEDRARAASGPAGN